MKGNLVALDNNETQLQSQPGSCNQDILALGLLIENLRVLTLNLMKVVEEMEGFRSPGWNRPIRLSDEVQRFEKALIESALTLTRGNKSKAAHVLGVKLTTLHYKIKGYRIHTRHNAACVAGVRRNGDGDGQLR